ncbi:hypothetical protein HY480_00045 [Candidatus Uhrbacteria bacterium]|nr:hypothetical protein [Candidatus Uhrbacteria bacterium]
MGHRSALLRSLRRSYFPGRWVEILPTGRTAIGLPREYREAEIVSFTVPEDGDARIVVSARSEQRLERRVCIVPLRYIQLLPLTFAQRPLAPRADDEPPED